MPHLGRRGYLRSNVLPGLVHRCRNATNLRCGCWAGALCGQPLPAGRTPFRCHACSCSGGFLEMLLGGAASTLSTFPPGEEHPLPLSPQTRLPVSISHAPASFPLKAPPKVFIFLRGRFHLSESVAEEGDPCYKCLDGRLKNYIQRTFISHGLRQRLAFLQNALWMCGPASAPGRHRHSSARSILSADILERPSTAGGGGSPPTDPPPSPSNAADSQNFASAPSVPRGFTLQSSWPAFGGDHKGTVGVGRPPAKPPPPPSNTSLGMCTHTHTHTHTPDL